VLPDLSAAPTYQLIDQNAQPFGSEDLDGKVVLYNFVFTHCTTVCPAMTGQMLQIQNRLAAQGMLGRDVELVTITFDPERDTSERLAEYAASVNASDTDWHWLTGNLIEIKQLVGGDFGVYFERVPLSEDALVAGHDHEGYDFVHSTVFVIVDGGGEIRAEYQQMLDIDQTLRDIKLVVREQQAGPLLRPLFLAAHSIRAYP
jgi:protein SCO1/2